MISSTMPASQLATSTSSLSSVAGQPSLSFEMSHDFKKRSTNLWLPLSPFPIYSWDVQEDIKDDQRNDESRASTTPRTPGLSWDSAPNSSEIRDRTLKSTFEDWEDPLIPSSSIYIENDGTQTLFITPKSAFFYPPPSPRPFGYAPFSNGFTEEDLAIAKQTHLDDSESNGELPLTPKTLEHVITPKQPKGRVLFVDTTYPSFGSEWSASILYSPMPADEAASWAPKGFVYGPDVPLDCIYSAGDVSPVERWDEKLWSPILRKSLRTAPCV